MSESAKYLPDIHRMLPQSPEAEQGVLSAFVLSPVEVGGMCAEKGITLEHFHIPAHGIIFRTLMRLANEGQAIDFVTIGEALRAEKLFEQVGGAGFITSLFTYLATAANAEYYLGILQEKHVLRKIVRVGTEYAGRGYDAQEDVPALLDLFEREALSIRSAVETSRRHSIKELTMGAIGDIQRLYENRGTITGIETGFRGIDEKLDGMLPGDFTVIAARPGYGKTAFAMNIAEHIAVNLGIPVAVFSLEMSAKQLAKRVMSSLARVNLVAVRNGFLSERDFPALTAAAAKLAGSPLIIDDTSSLSIEALKAKARRFKRENKIKAIFIDYLQLMRSTSKRAQDNAVQELTDISSGLKAVAKELDISVVALAQLNRDVSKGQARQPKPSDLRGSGSIEQDADNIIFLRNYEKEAEEAEAGGEAMQETRGKVDAIVAKQRNGETGRVPLTFLKEFTRFEDRAECGEPLI